MQLARQYIKAIDESKDSLLTAIAKAGGVSLAEGRMSGFDGPELRTRGWSIYRVFTKNGDSFDGMAERLSQYGYVPPPDEVSLQTTNRHSAEAQSEAYHAYRQWTVNWFEDALRRDLSHRVCGAGNAVYSVAVDCQEIYGSDPGDDQAEREAEMDARAAAMSYMRWDYFLCTQLKKPLFGEIYDQSYCESFVSYPKFNCEGEQIVDEWELYENPPPPGVIAEPKRKKRPTKWEQQCAANAWRKEFSMRGRDLGHEEWESLVFQEEYKNQAIPGFANRVYLRCTGEEEEPYWYVYGDPLFSLDEPLEETDHSEEDELVRIYYANGRCDQETLDERAKEAALRERIMTVGYSAAMREIENVEPVTDSNVTPESIHVELEATPESILVELEATPEPPAKPFPPP